MIDKREGGAPARREGDCLACGINYQISTKRVKQHFFLFHPAIAFLFLVQEYLKQFNELFEELQSKKVGVMAVCAQPQDKVDEMEKKLNLKFKVSTLFEWKIGLVHASITTRNPTDLICTKSHLLQNAI